MNAACIFNLLRNNRPQLMQRNRSGKLALSNLLDQMNSAAMGHPPACVVKTVISCQNGIKMVGRKKSIES